MNKTIKNTQFINKKDVVITESFKRLFYKKLSSTSKSA